MFCYTRFCWRAVGNDSKRPFERFIVTSDPLYVVRVCWIHKTALTESLVVTLDSSRIFFRPGYEKWWMGILEDKFVLREK